MERMGQYEVLKEKWRGELQIALESEENNSEELERYLNPAYCTNNNEDNHLTNDNNSIEVQQQLMFAKIEAQVYGILVGQWVYAFDMHIIPLSFPVTHLRLCVLASLINKIIQK